MWVSRRLHRISISAAIFVAIAISATGLLGIGSTHAQQLEEHPCPSEIYVDMPIQGIAFEPNVERVDLAMTICNGTDATQEVQFNLTTVPDEWIVFVRPKIGSYAITAISIEPQSSQDMKLRVTPAVPRVPGSYEVALTVFQNDNVIKEITLTVDIPGRAVEEEEEVQEPLSLNAPFPVLRGPADSEFEYEVEVRNRIGTDTTFDLTAQSPQGWDVSFKPAFEDKLISSISVENNRSQSVKVQVDTPRQADIGAYPVVVRATSEDTEQQLLLRVDITGTFNVLLSTPNNRLNMDAAAGDSSPGQLRLINTGNAPLEGLKFSADPPTDWKVNFEFPGLVSMEPQAIVDVPFEIVPNTDAVPGDYVIVFQTSNAQVTDSLEMRVTLTQSTVWGWVGIALVLVVIVALIGLFVKLGRR